MSKRDEARQAARSGQTTKSQSLFGAALIFFVVGLAAGILAGVNAKTLDIDGTESFGMIPFAVFTGAGLIGAAVCYAASVIADQTR